LQEQTQTKSEEWFDETKKNQLEDLAGTVTWSCTGGIPVWACICK
jgi:hypothetical protein